MELIYVNGSRVNVVRTVMRNAYSLPHAYLLDDGTYLIQESEGPTKGAWMLLRGGSIPPEPVNVTIYLCQ